MATIWSKLTGLDDKQLSESSQEIKIEKTETPKKIKKDKHINTSKEENGEWLPQVSEGKLSIDVYLKEENVFIISAIAGVKPENLEILVDRDILTLKGERKNDFQTDKKDYLHQECFWGSFSRTVLLPCEIKTDEVKANLKNGILVIKLPMKGEMKENESTSKIKVTKK
jgi:HSP20 family molecular chaperone IbpA